MLNVFAFPLVLYGSEIENVKFTHIATEDGLSHHEVLFVFQDTLGFMWFGTKNGLNKYDGMRILPYFHSHDRSSITGNFAHWIREDKSGDLWISTWGDGISRYDPKSDKFANYYNEENNPQSIASNNVWSLYVDSKGLVWAATDDGLSKLDPAGNTFVNYRHDPRNPESISHNTVSRICEDDQGNLLISTYGGGLNIFDPSTEKFTHYKHIKNDSQSLSNNNLWGVFVDSSNRIWIASEKGLNRFDPKTETFVSYQQNANDPSSLSSNTVTFIYEDHTGKLWLGTFGGGLNRFDPEKETFVHYRHDSQDVYSLSNDIVMSIYEDSTGTIWVATYGGVDKYDPGEYQFEYYRKTPNNPKGLNNEKVRSIYQDRNGSIYIGTGGGGLNVFNKERNSMVHHLHDNNNQNSISDNDIWAISEDKRGDLWVATHGAGLNKFIPSQNKFIRYEHDSDNANTPDSDSLYDLIVDEKRDVLWIAAYLSGLDKYDIVNETFTHYRYDPNNPDGLVSNWSTVVFVDSNGFIWIGTEAGLSLFDPETEQFTNFKHDRDDQNSLSSNMIQAIFEDSRNTIWIGTGSGLNRYEEGTHSFVKYFEKDGLIGNHIAGILEDSKGALWISTDNGISEFNYQNGTFRSYNRLDGLQGNRFLMHSAHANAEGELFFGGVNGFNAFRPDKLKDNQNLPRAVFTDFQIQNRPVMVGESSALREHINQAQKISMAYDQQLFSIEFVALNYRHSHKNQYAYMLEGFDKDFTFTGSSHRYATYTNLDPGNYTFHVKGSNNDGIWNSEKTSIKISIRPPWWKTLWFKLFIIASIILIILGVFNYIMKLNSEIKQRLTAQKLLHESDEKWRSLAKNAPSFLTIVNKDHIIEYINSPVSGLKHEEVIGQTVYEFIQPEYHGIARKMINTVFETGQPSNYESLANGPEGTMAYYDNRLGPIIIADKTLAVSIFGLNITERRQAEEALRESEEKYRSMMESFADPLYICSPDLKIAYMNPAMIKRVGRDATGEACYHGLHGLSSKCEWCIYDQIAVGEIVETNIKSPLDDRNYRVTNMPIHQQDGTVSKMTIFRDISDYLQAISEKEIAQAQLMQSQKMESVGNLAGGIAHDFNNILSSIIGFTELSLDDVEKGTHIEDNLQEVYAAGKRAKDLVKQILAFARQSDEERKPIQVDLIIKEVLQFIRSSIPTTIEITQNIESESLIMGSSTQVHQILMNLCTNAAYAMENEGGTLEVSLQDITVDRSANWKSMDLKLGDYIEIKVSDTGTGIQPEILKNIFEPYFTTKGPGEGTGMGLAMVHGIVDSYGGKIMVDSILGKGTIFTIYLPITRKRGDHRAYESEELPSGTERVLFVDDEASIAKMGRQVLERLGYKVTIRTSTVEALELFRSKPNDFDLVITDMTMPNMTGDKFASELLKIRPDIPVILCTGYSKKISDENAAEIGIKAFAYKPIVKADLAKTVRKVLDEAKG